MMDGNRPVDLIDRLVIDPAKVLVNGTEQLVRLTLLEPSKLRNVINEDGSVRAVYEGKMLIESIESGKPQPAQK